MRRLKEISCWFWLMVGILGASSFLVYLHTLPKPNPTVTEVSKIPTAKIAKSGLIKTVTTDGADVQALIDAAVAYPPNGTSNVVNLPAGIITLNQPLNIGFTGNPFHFTTVKLIGAGRAFNGDSGFTGTVIVCNYNNGPAINFYGARDSSIEHCTIVGPYAATLSGNVPGLNLTDWPGLRSQNSPSCGVAVDATGPTGSSGIVLNDVEINGFEVGFATCPGGADGQGEFPSITNSRIRNCTWAISICQTQMRLLSVRTCDFLNCHTVITNQVHGLQSGEINGLFSSCSFNQVVQLCNVNQAISQSLVFQSCYGELIGSIGSFYTGGARSSKDTVFRDCDFMLNLATDKRTLCLGGSIIMDGGTWITQDIAVMDTEVECRSTKIRPEYYETSPFTFSAARRNAANKSLSLLGPMNTINSRPRRPQTTAYFTSPNSSNAQLGYTGNPTTFTTRVFSKNVCNYANDTITFPNMGGVSLLGAIIQDDRPGRTCWVVIGSASGRWVMERINNIGTTIDTVNGNFYIMQ